ncbi:MAG: phosphoribosylamine--glycine ligase [Pelagibacteraceae bacterium TMED170]|nr:MAG: phosphoribosylamine--glycine ligase [Pelagibacteraceae bacterium TMED170]|tara:strand:+ start:5938 stop:7197 length:1260 start_codon:yes stop_codon:yes gene_type:complete
MNIALIGSGGREHALCFKILKSPKVSKVFCIPGNAGTSKIATNLQIDYLNFGLLLRTIKLKKIDLVIIGPEQPLVDGIVDFLEKHKIKVFGPNKYAAQLEGSKAFMKSICKKNNIPTANFQICKKKIDVLKFLSKSKLPVVVKADGLAAGKGVTICYSQKEVLKISNEIFLGKFKSSKKLIIEEFLSGEEASYFSVVDNKTFSFIGSAQDHKRVGENETGPNTGGMGAYSPALIINNKLEEKIKNKIIKPTLLALKRKGKPFKGFLYTGLMIKNNEPYLIEYNIRMGDPECQVIIPRLETDIIDIILSCVENKLKKLKIKWKKNKCMTIVLCSKGYPNKYKKNKVIKNLKKLMLNKNSIIFHAGTSLKNKKIIATGGRVLNITSMGNSFIKIRKNIFKIIKKINWKHGFYRKDIGWRVI